MRNATSWSEQDLRSAKKALRERVIAQRDALDVALRRRHSQLITDKLLALPEYRASGVICAYASFGAEFDTGSFLAALLDAGKRLLLPRINKARHMLELREVRDPRADLTSGVWGIREPGEQCPMVSPAAVEFILVPGVAFTAQGQRLGYGGGYYDRLLAEARPETLRVAAAFSLQVVDDLPSGDRDQRVHRIVTESDVLRCSDG